MAARHEIGLSPRRERDRPARERLWLAPGAAVVLGFAAVACGVVGGLLAAKTINPNSCSPAPHEGLGGLLLLTAVFVLAPLAFAAGTLCMLRGPVRTRVVGVLVTVAVIVMVIVVFRVGDSGTFHCGR